MVRLRYSFLQGINGLVMKTHKTVKRAGGYTTTRTLTKSGRTKVTQSKVQNGIRTSMNMLTGATKRRKV